MPIIADNDLLRSTNATNGDRHLDVHRLGIKGIPDQLGQDVDRARTLNVAENRVPARAYLLGLHSNSLRTSDRFTMPSTRRAHARGGVNPTNSTGG